MQPAKAPTLSAQGAQIPVIGYGTMLFPEPERAVELVAHSLECGYRDLDTARKSGSEEWVGEGIRASALPREDIWVTTKVTEENAKPDDFARSLDISLKALGLDYADLLLIHWPQPKVLLEETLGALAKVKRDVPLACGEVVTDPVIQKVAKSRNKTASQVALKLLIQQPDIAVVPRSLEPSQIEENIDLFDFQLSEDEMTQISALRD